MQRLVSDVDRLVRAHRERLADRVGGPVRADGHHGDLAALRLLDQQSLLDGALVDLVEHGVGRLTVQRVVAVESLRSE